ncbi:diaminopimelate epimerase [Phytoactinopolyspora alkaliphila]|uniref:Diaminopimelate epimerase n=1 Tax=Phytoactinopolyspora alkaliphila TaxID=1783498 RepID=A0A6N9YFN1_9ACTN|nr:diaminopimelate epimerase [Phytoactinopolyspora alkaliphila]NED93793.1 diaminopimelate epimerase [Phytoactinopolyspora alkaliphila]
MTTHIPFVKGHGTENDFILVPDPDGSMGDILAGHVVRRLTDRYAGIGADGLIRVVRTAAAPDVAALADRAEWFMDYRNADGSLAEMCGNGVRVMARYLFDHGLAGDASELAVATRGGVRAVRAEPDGQYTVEMGPATQPVAGGAAAGARGVPEDAEPAVEVILGRRSWPAVPVAVPNPHAVVFLDDEPSAAASFGETKEGRAGASEAAGPDHGVFLDGHLGDLGLLAAVPSFRPEPVFPDGANVEFVVSRGDRHIALRVWERGVGETRSCGTGVCAAAWAAMRRDGEAAATYTVDVPGGRLVVTERADGQLLLTGPAELGVQGTIAV